MGRDLFAFPEPIVNGRHQSGPDVRVFDRRHHGMWAFLGWREQGRDPCHGRAAWHPRRWVALRAFLSDGLVDDMDGMSWLSVKELLAFDYVATCGGAFRITAEDDDGRFVYEPDPAAATEMTFRRFLRPGFLKELDRLAASGANRIVFFTV